MASAELAVAKASLSGALFRADPAPCSRDQIEDVLALLNSTACHCSPSNVQKCKQWALENLVPSTNRIAPFGKYVVALSRSFRQEDDKGNERPSPFNPKKPKATSAKRKRLHVLYILGDLLYHVKFRLHDPLFAAKLEPTLPALVRLAASFPNAPKHTQRIQRLISLWEANEYFPQSFTFTLRSIVDARPSETGQTVGAATNPVDFANNSTTKATKSAPFVLPAMHGDQTTPWYDLPAGNWLPVLEPNSTRPLNPAMIKPLQLASGPADTKLVEAVTKLLLDVDRIYAKDLSLDQSSMDIGQMGECVEVDELGQVIAEDTYYGWSRSFCEKMKARRRGRDGQGSGSPGRSSRSYTHSRGRSATPPRSRDRNSSRDSSRPAFKRRRMSSSSSPRKWGPDTSRSSSHSRDSNQPRRRDYSQSRSRSRSRSGRYRSRTPDRESGALPHQRNQGNPIHSSGAPPPLGLPQRPPPSNGFHPGPLNAPGAGAFYHQPSLSQPRHPQATNFPSYMAPIPPPPPPNYQGPWPPPPPPMGVQAQGFYHEGQPTQPFIGGWTAPPPPPPPRGGFGYGSRGAAGGPVRGSNTGGSTGGRGYGRGSW